MPAYPTNHYATPATYIAFDKGKYWLVHYGDLITDAMITKKDAINAATLLDVDVSSHVWHIETTIPK